MIKQTASSAPTRSRHPGNIVLMSALVMLIGGGLLIADESRGPGGSIPNMHPFQDESGAYATFNLGGDLDTSNPFFQDLGTNGRRCVTCHEPNDGWTITPSHLEQRFRTSRGKDPVFRLNDGSGCPTQDVSTEEARRRAYTLLLSKGLIRVERSVPATAEYTVLDAENPYGCGSTTNVSVYRRPLPSTNLSFLSTVMWDGRETFKDGSGKFQPIRFDLRQQTIDATTGHAQGNVPSEAQIQQIIDFEIKLFTAQIRDNEAGNLDEDGAKGGPKQLSKQNFFLGINDPLGGNPTGAAFSPNIFDIFDSWNHIDDEEYDEHTAARRSVARGEMLFNTLPIPIVGVGGLNDVLNAPLINGFCGTCHDSPNVGNHSVVAPLNIGLVTAEQRTSDLPLITLRNNTSGELMQVSDPGRGLITGKWADIGKFKGPILRNLSARAPYFHNGSAATLLDVLNFYDTRFKLHLSQQDKDDLVAFLKTL